MNSKWLNGFALVSVTLSAALVAFGNLNSDASDRLLNVSSNSTQALYKDLNANFVAKFRNDTGRSVSIQQVHGESDGQAKAVMAGLKADVVTLAESSDVDKLHDQGLVKADWSKRLPHNSHPYSSTIVFVVHRGNPKAIVDWPDLVKPGVTLADSEASHDSRFGLMAAYGSVVCRGGNPEQARQFVHRVQTHLAKPKTGAADVELAWENEALVASDHSNGELLVVYPPVSIRGEPSVTWVDADVDGTPKEEFAKAYLEFLYSAQAQEIIAEHDLRPSDASVLKKHSARLPELNLFPAELVTANLGASFQAGAQ